MLKYRSVDGSYYKGTAKNAEGVSEPVVYSAYQRKEILEGYLYMKNGIEYMHWDVIGHWDDYEKASAEVEAFNRKTDESISNR